MNAFGAHHFGSFILNRARGCLEDETGAECFLRPKSYRVLEVLCQRRGQLVSKDDLIQQVWPDVFASDDSLAQCISEIRRALGPESSKLLRTVPRRGYILAAEDIRAGSVNLSSPAQTPRFSRVLVFVASVAVVGTLSWTWWTSQGSSPQAATKAADASVLEADALLEARDWRQRGDNERARALLENVVAEHPDNAEAWSALGLTYWLEVQHIAWGGGRREMTRAFEMLERAVTLGNSARSHRLLAEMRLLAPFPDMRLPVDALVNARAAVALEPSEPDNLVVLAHVLALTGRSNEAVETIERALYLDPTPPDWHRQVAGLSYLLAGHAAHAAEELGPLYGAGTFVGSRWWPGWLFAASLAHTGRTQEAAAVIHAAKGRRPEQSVAAVALSLDGIIDGTGLNLILDGLRRAGMPG